MRDRSSIVAVLVCALVLAACTTPQRQAEPPPGRDEAPGAPAEPVRGGRLVAAIDSDPGSLNPAITTSGATHTASELIYNGLVDLGPDLEPIPELAERWDVEDDGRLYRFHLREGVKWHDGTPFTAADVAFTFQQVLLQYHSRTKASILPALRTIEAIDDTTVEFRFNQPYAPLLQQLNVTEAPILPLHIYEDGDPQTNRANNAPVGTGPFKFVSYDPGAEIRLERNPDYFEDGLPYLDDIVMRVIPDEGSQLIAFEAGEVDWLWTVPGPDQARLQDEPDVEFLQTAINPGGSNCIMTVSFNLERPMFEDVRVRRAFAHGLDRDQILERAQFGEGRVAAAPIHSGIGFAHATGLDMPDNDPGQAERLLDEAGWTRQGQGVRVARGVSGVPDGTPLAFDFLHFPTFAPYGELVRAQLREIGMDVTLQPMEPQAFADTVFKERDFDTNIISYCNGTDPEIGVRRMYTSANIGPVPFSNAAAYTDRDVDRLFDEAQQTVDQDDRGRLYREIQEIVVDDLPYFWIVETLSSRAYRADCRGFQPSGHFAETAYCRG